MSWGGYCSPKLFINIEEKKIISRQQKLKDSLEKLNDKIDTEN